MKRKSIQKSSVSVKCKLVKDFNINLMTTSIRIKSKLSPNSRAGPEVLHFGKKGLMNTCRSDPLLSFNEKKLLKSLQDSKVIHNVNLQIPSLNSPNLSTSNSKNKKKQSASIKGFTSKISVRPSKDGLKTKKSTKEFMIREGVSEMTQDVEISRENNLKNHDGLESELKKAIDENKRLRKIMDEEKGFESQIDEMMKSFKSRLFKFLYD
jgi:hypothetical protein